MPIASSSVRDALKIFCTPPRSSAKRRAFVGPNPGVKASASHWRVGASPVLAGVSTASDTQPPTKAPIADSIHGGKFLSRLDDTMETQWSDKISYWQHETPAYFRHFVPQHRASDVGFRARRRGLSFRYFLHRTLAMRRGSERGNGGYRHHPGRGLRHHSPSYDSSRSGHRFPSRGSFHPAGQQGSAGRDSCRRGG